jgi:hypothetical protein
MKAYRGNGCVAPFIINFLIRCRLMVKFTLLPLYPLGKSFQCPLNGTPGRVWSVVRR